MTSRTKEKISQSKIKSLFTKSFVPSDAPSQLPLILKADTGASQHYVRDEDRHFLQNCKL